MFTTTLAVSSLLLASAPAVFAQSTGTGSCTDVHIFIARGWNEDYPGRQGNLTTRVCADLPGMSCDYEDIAYDAYSTDYCPSVAAGEVLALSQINAYYAKCPNSAIVLSGYSEGATVMGNVLAGDSGDAFCPSQGNAGLTDTTSGVSCNIAAVTLFGNPRHTANQPYNVLGGAAAQANSHRDAAGLARMMTYSSRMHDYCNTDDLICAPGYGADTVEAHTDYFQLYSAEAAQYIADTVKGYSKSKYCAVPTSSSSSSTASSTASSSSIASTVSSSSLAGNVSVSTTSVPSGSTSVAVTLTESYSQSSPSSVPYITVTDVTSIYTTVCPQSSVYTTGNMTRTSTWTGPSTVTSTSSATITTTVPATYIATVSSVKTSAVTTIGSSSAAIEYTTSVYTTTLWNFPTLTITQAVPTATYWLNGQGNSNGTKVTGFVASGSGAGSYPTSTGAPISPYTGAASAQGVAAKFLVVVAGIAGAMML